MKTKTKLELLLAMQKRRRSTQAGFTLVEVLVVAGILAILFASLVPNLLEARTRAAASAVIAEAVGIARGCQAVIASGTGNDNFVSPGNNSTISCNGGNATLTPNGNFVSRAWTGELLAAEGISCVGIAVNKTGVGPHSVTAVVNTAGTLSCSL